MGSYSEDKFLTLLKQPIKSKAEIEEMENSRIEFEKELAEEESILIKQLKEVNINISSVWDLVNTKKEYPVAIPILIEHLSRDYHKRIKEGIIRALSVKEAKGKATPALLAEFIRTPIENQNLRWVIGNTVYTTITQEDVKSILPIVRNKANGNSRQMFILALGKVKSNESEQALIDILSDDDVAPFAIEALGVLKSEKAKEKIKSLLYHYNPQIKKEAQKTLKKIG